jgi:CheY-like chemotaxis protein
MGHKPKIAKILIVEDSKADQLLIERLFSRYFPANEIDIAPTLEDARGLLYGNEYDIVMIDRNLGGGVYGDELVRDTALFPDSTIVVFLSGENSPSALQELEKIGVEFFVPKPLTEHSMRALVEEIKGMEISNVITRSYVNLALS